MSSPPLIFFFVALHSTDVRWRSVLLVHRMKQGLAVSPSQEYAVVTTADNAVSLVGLAGELWRMSPLNSG